MDDKTFVLAIYPYAELTRGQNQCWYLRLVPGGDAIVYSKLMAEADCWRPARTYIQGQQMMATQR